MKLPLVEIQRFCMHDGPGIRTTVFIKGCPLRCKWCHNPETHKKENEIYYSPSKCIQCGNCNICKNGAHQFTTGKHVFDRDRCLMNEDCVKVCPTKALESVSQEMSIDKIISEVLRDVAFYGKEGGMTISGGEPMAYPTETIALLKVAKENNLNTAVETCGYFDKAFLPALCQYTDTLLWDFKDSDRERHIEYTGVSNERIIENLLLADSLKANIELRCILVNTVNFTKEHIKEVAALYKKLPHCKNVKLFSYHPMGNAKMEKLGRIGKERKEWIVSTADLKRAKAEFSRHISTL